MPTPTELQQQLAALAGQLVAHADNQAATVEDIQRQLAEATATLAVRDAQLAARETQLAAQSLRMAELQAQADAAAEALETRTRERDRARQESADLRPPTGTVVPRGEFKKRLAPAFLVLPDATEKIQRKWDRILDKMLGDYHEVRLTDPTIIALVNTAVADGLLTQKQAQTVLATT
jgi:uncharacterized protein (DUF736 family)